MSFASVQSFPVREYNLAATLSSGQAFRWECDGESWVGVIDQRWVRLRVRDRLLLAETTEPVNNWRWLSDYLQLEVDIEQITKSFPIDEPMQTAVAACRGLRLLRQDPWECLASFILSSTKQIVQIQQIIRALCRCFGEPIAVPSGFADTWTFPSARALAGASETELRSCKMGFRAPYLLAAARRIVSRETDLERIRALAPEMARAELMLVPGVGRKIADCVLLFAYGFQSAFPVDVWVMKALRQLYFPRRRVKLPRLQRFAASHFGTNAGYAQQYLFHYMRTMSRPVEPRPAPTRKQGAEPAKASRCFL